MSSDKDIEEILCIMEKEERPTQLQISIFIDMISNYSGNRFDEHYDRFRKLEYR